MSGMTASPWLNPWTFHWRDKQYLGKWSSHIIWVSSSDSSSVIHHFLNLFVISNFSFFISCTSHSLLFAVSVFLSPSSTSGASVTTSSLPVLCCVSLCFYFNHMASCYLSLPVFPFSLPHALPLSLSLSCFLTAIASQFAVHIRTQL